MNRSTSRRPLPARALSALVVSGALVASLAACSAGGQGGAGPTATASAPTATTTVTASASPSASQAAPASTTSSSPSYRVARCTTDHLTGSLGSGEGAAGSTIVPLVLQNTGSAPCSLQGWPGVSFVDASGGQVGASAVLDRSSEHQTVTLLPNGHAQAMLKIADARNYPSSTCEPVTVTRLRVYPPGSTTSIIVRTGSLLACRSSADQILTTQAFTPVS